MNKKGREAVERRYDRDPDFADLVNRLGKHLTFYPFSKQALRKACEYVISDIRTIKLQLEEKPDGPEVAAQSGSGRENAVAA
jgi:hypothetical protein